MFQSLVAYTINSQWRWINSKCVELHTWTFIPSRLRKGMLQSFVLYDKSRTRYANEFQMCSFSDTTSIAKSVAFKWNLPLFFQMCKITSQCTQFIIIINVAVELERNIMFHSLKVYNDQSNPQARYSMHINSQSEQIFRYAQFHSRCSILIKFTDRWSEMHIIPQCRKFQASLSSEPKWTNGMFKKVVVAPWFMSLFRNAQIKCPQSLFLLYSYIFCLMNSASNSPWRSTHVYIHSGALQFSILNNFTTPKQTHL